MIDRMPIEGDRLVYQSGPTYEKIYYTVVSPELGLSRSHDACVVDNPDILTIQNEETKEVTWIIARFHDGFNKHLSFNI